MRTYVLALFLACVLHGFSQNCNNINFELSTPGAYTLSNAVNGWTISSQYSTSCQTTTWQPGSGEFSLIATPISALSGIGTLQHSPLGGTLIAVLNNNSGNGLATRLTRTISVSSANVHLNYAFAFETDGIDHNDCCVNPRVEVLLKGPQGSNDQCLSRTITTLPGCSATNSYTGGANYSYSNWQPGTLNLSSYTGSVVTLEVIARDCAYSGHFFQLFFDAECSNTPVPVSITALDNNSRVHYCAGTNTAIITAPPGTISYTWTAPTGSLPLSQATASALTISSPTAGQVYTLAMTTTAGCIAVRAYTLVYTTVGSGTNVTSVACGTSATGGATLYPIGSGVGYNATWYNSSSSVVATGVTVNNIPPGTYNVYITALNAAGCGSASASVYIPSFSVNSTLSASLISLCKGDSATAMIFYSGSPSALTFSWAPPVFLSTTNSPVTVITPTVISGGTVSVTYSVTVTNTTMPGCPQTKTIIVQQGDPKPTIISPATICNNAPTIQFTVTPVGGIFSGGGPGFSNGVLNPTSFTPGGYVVNYAVTSAGCTRSTSATFIVLSNPTLAVIANPTVCAGTLATFTAIGADTYTWVNYGYSPTLSVIPVGGTIYTVTGASTVTSCKDTQTISPLVAPQPSLMVSGPDSLCEGESALFVATGADNYLWLPQNITTATQQVSPAAGTNVYTLVGTNNLGNCNLSVTKKVISIPIPTLSLGGPSLVCEGEIVTLTASGADSFLWQNNTSTSTFTFYAAAGVYSVTGINAAYCFDTAYFVVQVDPCTGLAYADVAPAILHPNPANGFVICTNCVGEKLNVLDAKGVLIISFNVNSDSQPLDIRTLHPGIYFFTFERSGRTVKVILQN